MPATRGLDAATAQSLRAAGQEHVLRWWSEIGPKGRARLGAQLRQIDWAELTRLILDLKAGRLRKRGPECEPEPPPYIPLPRTFDDILRSEQALATGEALLRAGKVAALMVAGGQGTRLGFDGPKGAFPVGPVSQKSLYQLHAERVLATRRRYRTSLPWYIMTSDATDAPTRKFFSAALFFGLPRKDVLFFRQRMIPALDRNFRLVLIAKDQILMSPNGHGGVLSALAESGMLDDMERRGIEQISYFQVDNPLIPAFDPVFIGHHALAGADMSSKAVWKRHPEEPLGAFVRLGECLCVVEYSDLTKEQMHQRRDGWLLYGLGSIAAHAIRVEFVRKLTSRSCSLPYHVAEKTSPCLDESGNIIQPTEKNVLKFETFIFDALREANASIVLEVRRQEEFSPLKNASGPDSPETCRRDITALYGAWLAQAGIEVPRDTDGRPIHPIEISPLYALDADELAARVPRTLEVSGPLYLAPERRK